jgi:ribosomal protein L35
VCAGPANNYHYASHKTAANRARKTRPKLVKPCDLKVVRRSMPYGHRRKAKN